MKIKQTQIYYLCERDMTKYGGHYVKSISMIFEQEINKKCNIKNAVFMFDPNSNKKYNKNI